VATSVEELVYDESRRSLDLQRDGLDALRTRSGTLLAAAALVTTFLGGQALEDNAPISTAPNIAIGCFIGLAALTLVVLLPWKFDFSLDAPDMVKDYIEEDPQPDLKWVHRRFAEFHYESREANKPRLKKLHRSFRIAVVLLGAEVVAWLIAL
jgi:hypothetical protein